MPIAFAKNSGNRMKMPLSLFPESWLRLSQTPGLTFGLEQAEDVILADYVRMLVSRSWGRYEVRGR